MPCFGPNGTSTSIIKGSWSLAPELLEGAEGLEQAKCRSVGGGPKSCTMRSRGGSTVPTPSGMPRRFQSSSCALREATPAGLMHAIGPSRNLHIFGDSIAQQHKGSLRCDLLHGGVMNNTGTGRTWPLQNGGRVSFYRVSTTKHLLRHLEKGTVGFEPQDVCLFNVGVHYNTPAEFQKDFLSYFESTCLQKQCLPCRIVWRESAHQHFPGPNGGLFTQAAKCKSCIPISAELAAKNNWRNEMANKLMRKYNIPILPIWHMTVSAHDMHPSVGGYAHSGCDCTHFCNYRAGMFEAWSTVLQSFLEVFET